MIMTAQTIAIQLPRALYHRLERLAELTGRPMESLVVQTLSSSIPPLPDDLPDEMRNELVGLEHLDDDSLWQVARSVFAPEHQEQLAELQDKRRLGTLTESDSATLAHLHQQADMLMLRKAYAYVLLKWRGHRLPTLAELEAQV
jgi:hypothetical protein